MRQRLYFAILLMASVCFLSAAYGQPDRFAYTISDLQPGETGRQTLRMMNMQTGQYSDALLNDIDEKQVVYDAVSKEQLAASADDHQNDYLQGTKGQGMTAIAYDKKNNRVWYTPMFIDQLRYIDLRTMKLYCITGESFAKSADTHPDAGKIINRLIIAPDGYGYALSNDGNTFIRFSTGEKIKIESLGPLKKYPISKNGSVPKACSGYGGDMVADDNGNLYIFSVRNQVFRVNIKTRVMKQVGAVAGLPGNFAINGTVVNEDGKLMVSSAVYANTKVIVNPSNWSVAEIKTVHNTYGNSDLSNSNILVTKPVKKNEVVVLKKIDNKIPGKVSLYPNPVHTSDNDFTIQFSRKEAGAYTIELSDASGRRILQQRVMITNERQTEKISITKTTARGLYMVNVMDWNNRPVFSQKLIVQ